MASSPRCSVIIPTYDRAQLLGYTLASLARQTLPVDRFEVLVCDDGSTDDTAEVVDGFRDRLDVRRYFHEHDGYGAGRARNVGIRHAAGEVCVLLDCGVLAHSGCLAAHLSSHAGADGPVGVIGYVYGYDFAGADAERLREAIDVWDTDATIERMADKQVHPDIREEFFARHAEDLAHLPAPWVMWWTCNVSVRTAQLRDVGMFDENFRSWGGEDVDLAYRLHRAGIRFELNRAACAVDYPHPKNFGQGLETSLANYRYMTTKYSSPVIRLLLAAPTINPFNLNDVIPALGLRPGGGPPRDAS